MPTPQSPSLDHLARLDIAELISPSVTIKDTKAPFPRLREKATVRLLAAAGRSLSHKVLEQRFRTGEDRSQQSIAKLKFIHRTLGYLSISRYVASSMRIGTALTGVSRKGKAVMFFAFIGWVAPCVMHSLKDHTWLLDIFQRISEISTTQNRTLVEEIGGEFELDLTQDAEHCDALYDTLRLEGEESRQVEADGLAILSEGLSQLVQKLDPQESTLLAAPYTEPGVPEEWLRLYAEKYLDLGPLVKAGRYPCSPLGAFLRAVAVVVPPRADLLVARIRRVHLLNSLANPLEQFEGHNSTLEGNTLEDNPTELRSSPRASLVADGLSGQTITRPTSVSSLLSSESDPTLLPETSRVEESSLNYSLTDHGSPRLKWGGLVAAMNWVKGTHKTDIPNPREAKESRHLEKVSSQMKRFSAKVIVPPTVPYPVSSDIADHEPVSDDSLQDSHQQTLMTLDGGSTDTALDSSAEETKGGGPSMSKRGQLAVESEIVIDHNGEEALDVSKSGARAILKEQNKMHVTERSHRRPVNAVNMRCGFESVEELEQALNAKRKSLGLDEDGAGNRIEEKVAQSRANSQSVHTAFASELQAKAAEMHRRIESWASSSPPTPPTVDSGTQNVEEIVTRSLIWDGMDPMDARVVAKKIDKRRVAQVLERLASNSQQRLVNTEEVAGLRAIESGRGSERWAMLKLVRQGKPVPRWGGIK